MILPGVAVHIIQRGNNRVACFRSDSDYLIYLAHLRQLSQKYACAVHAYCLMTNHVHLLLTPAAEEAPAALMRDLGQRYVQYFNRRHERTGTLWDGRFRSCLVESSRYVLGCYRYIELNPVRAQMVDHAAGYLWSSYAVNSGMRRDPSITPHPEYAALAEEADRRHAAYRGLVEEGVEPDVQRSIREATNAGLPLASEAFKSTILAPRGWKMEPGKPGPKVMSLEAGYALGTQFGL